MAGFAGYDMPIEFTGINDEHTAVRARAGVFDVSHMGEIWVKGPRALDLLRYVGSNDAASLYDGKIQYSCLPNGRGGIVDDILVYRIDAETYLLVVNAANGRERLEPSGRRRRTFRSPAPDANSTTHRTRSPSWPFRDRWRCGSSSALCPAADLGNSPIIRSSRPRSPASPTLSYRQRATPERADAKST